MSIEPPESAAASPLPAIEGYRLLRVLGHGGMSTVYLAEQESLGREVAIKVMLPEALADEVSRRRFENEARTVARLEHPHIVGIFEVGRTPEGLPYYAMPHLPRGHLGEMRFFESTDASGDEARIITILRALLAALDYAHARGVVHRDVKAENVLFDDAGRALLADFGIALRKDHGPRVTTAGLAVGSTAYMAPEQARGEEVDGSADLYSVGVLAWEMLTGSLPYVSGDALSTAMMHVQDPIPRLPPRLRHWQRFIDRAMAKSRANRFRTPGQMLEALDGIERRLRVPGRAALSLVGERIGSPRRWPRVAWATIVLLLAAAIALLLPFVRPTAPDAQDPRPVADAALADGVGATTRAAAAGPSPAQPFIEAATRQLGQRRLTQPEDDNAQASVLAAWAADPTHPGLPGTIDALLAALGAELANQLQAGDPERARDYMARAEAVAEATGRSDGQALAAVRATATAALEDGVGRAARRFDRRTATRIAEAATSFGASDALAATLREQASAVPGPGDRVPGDPAGAVLVRGASGLFAAVPVETSVADYASFARATKRPDTLCRERLSPLRIVAPRSWQAPGFAQASSAPVVCVSWSDADAYARWYAQRSGHAWRLPTATERRSLAGIAREGPRPVAEWLRECGNGCRERLVAGPSWRGVAGNEPREAARGFDDVGFRLVRDL
ncbi:MAG TPA: bifunctional serine/threonine-protein kinase/formylglycine-generating enzyme family protein [Xanthomonadaceae bacterium]|nr:bifunctional serine/threonine-protein kinase/formylglycine-generating enzyme family protein [Xanthomonadaceae bacterium]